MAQRRRSARPSMRSCGGLPAPGQAGAVSSLLSPSLSFPPLMQSSAPTRGSSLLAPPLALSLPPSRLPSPPPPPRLFRSSAPLFPLPSLPAHPSRLFPVLRAPARPAPAGAAIPRGVASSCAPTFLPPSTSPLVAGRPRRRRAPPGARIAGPFPCRCRGARPAAPLHPARHPEDARAPARSG